MKVGDSVPVQIAGQAVAMATVKEMGEGQAVLIVPATRVVMAVRTELSFEAPIREEGVETIIDGVDRASGEAATVDGNAVVAPGIADTNAVTQTDVGAVVTPSTVEPLPPVEVVTPTAPVVTSDDLTHTGHNPAADAAAQKEVPSE